MAKAQQDQAPKNHGGDRRQRRETTAARDHDEGQQRDARARRGQRSGGDLPRSGGGGHSYGGPEKRGGQSDSGGAPGGHGTDTDVRSDYGPNSSARDRDDAFAAGGRKDIPQAHGTPASGKSGVGVYGSVAGEKRASEHSTRVAEQDRDDRSTGRR